MRRLLLPLLVLSLAPLSGAADAGCHQDPEGNEECYAVDCLAWNPDPTQPPAVDDLLADPVHAVSVWLLPPVCPTY